MQSDLPHTLYQRGKRKRKGNENYTYNPDDPAIKKQLEANRKKKERLESEGKDVEYTMEELFNRS